MRRLIFMSAVLMFVFPVMLNAQDYLEQADAVYDKGDLESLKASIQLYIKAAQADPRSYEAAWKVARSYRQYADKAHQENVAGWKEICAKYGKAGMEWGKKAQALNPGGPEGWFFYALSVGIYSDGVSILRALSEGLKGKTQEGFEKAYAMDKMYEDGSPIKALGRFWMVLPFPLKNNKKAEQYLREFLKLFPNDPEGQVFLGELLKNMKKKDEARLWLNRAAASDDKYWVGEAKRMLAEL